MSRNRTIYNTESVYVGETPCTGIHYNSGTSTAYEILRQIHRVQNASYGFSLSRKDVNQFGQLAAIDRVLIDPPSVNFEFQFLAHSMVVETGIGFYANNTNGDENAWLVGDPGFSCLKYILDKSQDSKNYFAITFLEGIEANYPANAQFPLYLPKVIAVGNGFITSYRTEGAVGEFAKTTVGIQGLNIAFSNALGTFGPLGMFDYYEGQDYAGYTRWTQGSGFVFPNPAVNVVNGRKVYVKVPTTTIDNNDCLAPIGTTHPRNAQYSPLDAVSAFKPGDITVSIVRADSVNLSEAGFDISDAKIQSYAIDLPLNREDLFKLGSKIAYAKEIQFPLSASLSIQANVGDLTTGNLSNILVANVKYNATVNLKGKFMTSEMDYSFGANHLVSRYRLLNSTLDSVNYSNSIGASKSVTLNFTCQIGSSSQTGVGLFMDGDLYPYDAFNI